MDSDSTTADEFSPWFWGILADVKGDESTLRERLQNMSREGIVKFHREFVEAAAELQAPPFTDHLRGRSEDAISDIAEYVVSKGKGFYSEVLSHPERMPTDVGLHEPSIKGVALTVFWDRFGESIPR